MIEYMRKHQGNTHCPVCRLQELKERDLVVIRQNEGDTSSGGGSSSSNGGKRQATGTYANSTKVRWFCLFVCFSSFLVCLTSHTSQ